MAFVPGLNPDRVRAARAELLATGRCFKLAPAAAPAPTRARSLSKYRRRHLEQGEAGTCWLHAPTQLAEIRSRILGLVGYDVCRRLVGYVGKSYEGGGNPTDGGAGSDGIRALVECGMAHEALLPYSDDARTLGSRPPAPVFADAKPCHMSSAVDVAGLDDAARLVHQADTPTCLGIFWSYNWDTPNRWLVDWVGQGAYGHELLIIGHAPAGTLDKQELFQLDNWHGLLYAPLPPDQSAICDGYAPISPTATSDFWVTRRALDQVIAHGDAEFSSAADIAGMPSLFDPADALSPGS